MGLHSITDGEFRRTAWSAGFIWALDGLVPRDSLFDFTDERGDTIAWQTCYAERRVRRTRGIATEEFAFARTLTERTVKVTMPRFLPAIKQGIQLNKGGSAVLTVNLQSAWDVVRRAASREKAQPDDIIWTLRSSRSAQPVLRLAAAPKAEQPLKLQNADYSGYFQVYSKSVETSSGTSEGVGSQFSVTMPLDPTSKVTFAGQYNEIPTQPRGFGDRGRAAQPRNGTT